MQCRISYDLMRLAQVPVREHEFAAAVGRKWRFDFAWPELWVAVEIEGLRKIFIGNVPYAIGRHCTFSGFAEDCVKYAHAAILGWSVLRFNQALVKDGMALALTEQLCAAKLVARELAER